MNVLLGYVPVTRDGAREGEVGAMIGTTIYASEASAWERANRYVKRMPSMRGGAFVVSVYADLDPVTETTE